MFKKVEVKLKSDGVRELLKSSAVQEECMNRARTAANSLGEGFVAEEKNYPERSGAIVKATTYKAAKENSETECIQKAVFSS
jgi:hypothetical protein